jgi:hypothetical protein
MHVIKSPNVPHDFDGDYVTVSTPWGTSETLAVNPQALKSLHIHFVQNHFICVWSQGGHDWCQAVVKALGLEEKVSLVMTKPKWMIDDLPPSAWTKHVLPTKESK